MALSRVNQFNAGTVLTEAKLEGEFDNIYNNGTALISPLTGALDAGGNAISGVTSLTVATAVNIQSASNQIVFDSDGAAIGTLTWTPSASNKTLTLPNATDTLVGKATTDTLTNKTLTTPTIASFANAGHDHSNAAGGGALSAAVITSGTLPVGRGGTGITSTPTNGQIPIGNGTNYVAAAITAGLGIAVTNGSGSISIATTADAQAFPEMTLHVQMFS